MAKTLGRPMRMAASLAVIGAVAAVPATGAAQDAAPPEIDLRRVLLSTGGVGYFEYAAPVAGDAALTLDVRLDQVDDVLKSLVVYDPSGTLGPVTLPGRTPLGQVFADLPFDPADVGRPAALLEALVGAAVRVEGPRSAEGRVLGVTEEQRVPADGPATTVHRLTLATESGLAQVILEDVERLSFADAALRRQIGEALDALGDTGAGERRTLTLDLTGEGERTVTVAHLAEIPLWKTAYRLTFGAQDDGGDGTAEAGLQGWAVVENLTGADWDGVDLVLASGNPVTFRQALYDAYFVDRPEVPVEVLGRVLPPVDQGGVAAPTDMAEFERRGLAIGEPAPQALASMSMEDSAGAAPPPPSAPARLAAAEATEAATQVLFRYPRPVDLPRGHSMLLPIVDRDAPVERPLLYDADTHPTHPMATARIENTTGSGLPPGVLTVYERDAESGLVSYLGDARLDALPAGDSRLVAYALDQAVTVDRQSSSDQTLIRATLADGVLRRQIRARQVTTYTIEGAPNRDATVLLDHPRPGGDWQPAFDTAGAERTPDAWRLPVAVPAGETVTREIAFERGLLDTIAVADLDRERLVAWANARELPSAVRDALAAVAERMVQLETLEEAAKYSRESIRRIVDDQDRIRRNLASVPQGSDLHRRYVAELTAQEDELAALRATLERQEQAVTEARRNLADFIRGLSV